MKKNNEEIREIKVTLSDEEKKVFRDALMIMDNMIVQLEGLSDNIPVVLRSPYCTAEYTPEEICNIRTFLDMTTAGVPFAVTQLIPGEKAE